MDQRAPKSLLLTLFLLLLLSSSTAYWLEGNRLAWLQRHPISVNVISGIIGFCGATLTLAIVFNWFVDREKALALAESRFEAWRSSVSAIRRYTGVLAIVSPVVSRITANGRIDFPARTYLDRLTEAKNTAPLPKTYVEYQAYVDGLCEEILRRELVLTQPVFGRPGEVTPRWDHSIQRMISKMRAKGIHVLEKVREAGDHPSAHLSPERVRWLCDDIEEQARIAKRVARSMGRYQITWERKRSEDLLG